MRAFATKAKTKATATAARTLVGAAFWLLLGGRVWPATSTPAQGAATCPAPAPAGGPGLIDPFHTPAPAAAQLNADGKVLYRQERWEEARQRYRAAEQADPDFLAPALNVACSFVRQERFPEALAEVERLVNRAYLPWSHEVLSAADLGALKLWGGGKGLRAVLDEARRRWVTGLASDLIFVGRVRAPLRLANERPPGDRGGGAQALVLGQRQEIFAWSPLTRRYRQVTGEEGRVLAVARSHDGRRIAYATAEKLVRSANGPALRGVVISELDLGNLVPLGRAPVPGDVRRLDILVVGAGFAYRVDGSSGSTTFVLANGMLEPRPPDPRAPSRAVAVSLTGAGVAPKLEAEPLGSACDGATARDSHPANGTTPAVLVTSGGRRPAVVAVGGPHGAGLAGLPIP